MQIIKKHGKLLCRHKILKGTGQMIFLGDMLERENRLYFYQVQCSKCGKTFRLIGTAEEIDTWRNKKETN